MRPPRLLLDTNAPVKEKTMSAHPPRVLFAVLAALLAAASGVPPAGAADEAKPAPAAKPAAAAAAVQKHFASPEAAATALIAAAKAENWKAELLAVLGPEAKPILDSGDPVADEEGLERFVAGYAETHSIEKSDDWAELSIGKDDWPFPIPIVKEAAGWRFDTDEGDEEILARRIGRNERFTIQVMLAIVDAQREYYEKNPDQAPLLHYARRFLSSEGKRDGLYFPTAEGDEPSPLGSLVGEAREEGYRREAGKPAPFHGYYYRMLEAQGAHAPDGAYGYLASDRMIGGFAALAWPATWDNSGIMSFMLNQDGVVYQKDLGEDTEKAAQAIRSFDPDDSWKKSPEEDQAPEDPSDSVATE